MPNGKRVQTRVLCFETRPPPHMLRCRLSDRPIDSSSQRAASWALIWVCLDPPFKTNFPLLLKEAFHVETYLLHRKRCGFKGKAGVRTWFGLSTLHWIGSWKMSSTNPEHLKPTQEGSCERASKSNSNKTAPCSGDEQQQKGFQRQ